MIRLIVKLERGEDQEPAWSTFDVENPELETILRGAPLNLAGYELRVSPAPVKKEESIADKLAAMRKRNEEKEAEMKKKREEEAKRAPPSPKPAREKGNGRSRWFGLF